MFQQRLDRSALTHKKIKLGSFDHVVLRAIRESESPRHFLAVAVSGGMDSVCLLHVVKRLQPVLKLPVVVLHVHHGRTKNKSQLKYRRQSQAFVAKLARDYGFPFKTNRNLQGQELHSEAEMREHRYQFFNKNLRALSKVHGGPGLLLLAQHWNDLLETRLLRLIRGTGAAGLGGMQTHRGHLCRPLLQISRDQIVAHMQQFKLEHVEDPSNRQTDHLRNWLRQEWLPQLEQRQSGGVQRLALSLEGLQRDVAEQVANFTNVSVKDKGIVREIYQRLSVAEKKQNLVEYLQFLKVKGYTSKHVSELVKRLDTRKKGFKFTLLKLVWVVNAEHIRASKLR